MTHINAATLAFPRSKSMQTRAASFDVLTGFLLHQIRLAFSDPASISRENLRQSLWVQDYSGMREDPAKSRIRIELYSSPDDRAAGKLPAILLKRGAFEVSKIAVGGKRTLGEDMREQGGIVLPRTYKGSYEYIVCAGSVGVGEAIISELEEILNCVQNTAHTGLTEFAVSQVGEIQRVEKGKEVFAGAVSVRIEINKDFVLTPVAPVFSGFQVKTGVE